MFGKNKDNGVLNKEEQEKILLDFEVFLSCHLLRSRFTPELYMYLRDNNGFYSSMDSGRFYERHFQGYDNVKNSLELMMTAQHHSNPDYKELNGQLSKVACRCIDDTLRTVAGLEAIPLKVEIETLQKKLNDLMKKAS